MISARKLRAGIGEVDFEFYVRVWKDKSIWVGAKLPSEERQKILIERIEALGLNTATNGTPGTVGCYIIEVSSK